MKKYWSKHLTTLPFLLKNSRNWQPGKHMVVLLCVSQIPKRHPFRFSPAPGTSPRNHCPNKRFAKHSRTSRFGKRLLSRDGWSMKSWNSNKTCPEWYTFCEKNQEDVFVWYGWVALPIVLVHVHMQLHASQPGNKGKWICVLNSYEDWPE